MNQQQIERHLYYINNKEKINKYARDRYHMKKNNPDFLETCRSKNRQAYKERVKKPEKTQEEEEAYMAKIAKDIREIREQDEKLGRKEDFILFKTYLDLF